MKTSFLSFCLMVSSAFLFTQCKKDDTSPANATVNYSPLTVGSNWTYNFTENASAADTYTLTVTANDTTINGKKYNVLSTSDGSGNRYMAKIDSNYYRFASFADIGSFEELYLKDNLEVNGVWTNVVSINFQGFPVPLNLTYTVKEKGISHSVNANAYSDVIHIRLDATALGSNIGGGDFYYAKDIGLIDNDISLSYLGQSYTSKEQLTAHQIK